MSRSIITVWASIFPCNHVVLSATSSNLCIMCCMNVLQFYQACMSMSQSIIAAWASLSIATMLLLVLRHRTCASCVAWMCCRMSNSIKHVWACLDLSFHRHWLYTFLHCLRSNFSPSRPLQLWFEAACETSLARDIYATQSTPKDVEGATALYSKNQNMVHLISYGGVLYRRSVVSPIQALCSYRSVHVTLSCLFNGISFVVRGGGGGLV